MIGLGDTVTKFKKITRMHFHEFEYLPSTMWRSDAIINGGGFYKKEAMSKTKKKLHVHTKILLGLDAQVCHEKHNKKS
jgi:hypothetical protein